MKETCAELEEKRRSQFIEREKLTYTRCFHRIYTCIRDFIIRLFLCDIRVSHLFLKRELRPILRFLPRILHRAHSCSYAPCLLAIYLHLNKSVFLHDTRLRIYTYLHAVLMRSVARCIFQDTRWWKISRMHLPPRGRRVLITSCILLWTLHYCTYMLSE